MTAVLYVSPASIEGAALAGGECSSVALADFAVTSAIAAAEAAFLSLGRLPSDSTRGDLARRIEEGGLGPLLAWADFVGLVGLEREPWAREAALRAVRAYAGRLGELMATADKGGRS